MGGDPGGPTDTPTATGTATNTPESPEETPVPPSPTPGGLVVPNNFGGGDLETLTDLGWTALGAAMLVGTRKKRG